MLLQLGRKKVKEQRENVITELLVTEREYCRDLRLTCQVFELHDTQSLEKKGIDASILFGNLLEVRYPFFYTANCNILIYFPPIGH